MFDLNKGTIKDNVNFPILEQMKNELESIGITYTYESWGYIFQNKNGDISYYIRNDKISSFLEGLFAGLSQSISRIKLKKFYAKLEKMKTF